jgi:hypothetical protein
MNMERALNSEKSTEIAHPGATDSEIASYLFDLLGSAQRIAKARGMAALASKLEDARREAGRCR